MKKKAYVVVLLIGAALCTTGRGVFAQGFTFTGELNAGLFAQFTNMENAGPFIYGMSANESPPMQLELDAGYVNQDKTAGINAGLTLSVVDIAANVADQTYTISKLISVDDVYGWLKAFNGLLTLYGGVWESELFTTPGALESHLDSEGAGLVLAASPIAGLQIGLSGFAKTGHSTLLSEGKYIVSASYEMAGVFQVVANYALHQYGVLQFTDEESLSFNEQQAKDYRVSFGANYLGLKSLGFSKLAFDVEARDLGGGRNSRRDPFRDPIGGTVYPLYFGELIRWDNGFINLEGSFRQLIRIGDDHPLYAPSLTFLLTGSCKVNEYIVPKLGIEYFMNSLAWENETDMRFDEAADWEDCIKDTGGLGAYAAVEFRIGGDSKKVFELGYSLKADTSKDVKADARTSTLDQAVYASIKLGF